MPERKKCALCGNPGLLPLAGYSHAYLVRCSRCGLVQTARIPTPDEIREYYEAYPRDLPLSPVTVERYRSLLREFADILHREGRKPPFRLLDVGCGDGNFLRVAGEEGWDVLGVEVSQKAVEVAKQRGVPVWLGTLSTLPQPSESFDVITLFEVIEHVPDPLELLRDVWRFLHPGGVGYLTTPNFHSLSRRWLGPRWNVIEYPEHLVYFTPSTIRFALQRAGLNPVRIRTEGISIHRWRESLLRKGTRQLSSPQGDKSSFHPPAHTGPVDEQIRQWMHRVPLLRGLHRGVNHLLNMMLIGDTLKAWFRKN